MFRLDCGGKVLRDAALFPANRKQSGVAEYLAAAVQTMSLAYVTPDDDAFLLKDR